MQSYDCRVCVKKFSKFDYFEGHFAFSNKCRSKQNIFLQCYVCKKSFQHSTTLKYHLQLHSTKNVNPQHKQSVNVDPNQNDHQDAPKTIEFKCNMCEGSFRSRFALHRHLLITHNNINIRKSKTRHASTTSPTISSVLFRCKVCKIFLGSRERLASHENVHVNGKIECEICQIKFTEKSLRCHNKLSHPHLLTGRSISKPLERNVFIEHKESRMDESRKDKVKVKLPKTSLACEICNIMCKNRKRLDCHLKVHVDGQFKCEICQIWFTKRSLEMHERRLHPHIRKQRILEALRNPKPRKRFEVKRRQTNYTHQCSVCKLRFMNEKQLETHMRIHIYGDVECEICQIRFTKRSLEMHVRRRHAEQRTKQIISKALERHNTTQRSEIKEKSRFDPYLRQCTVCKLVCITQTALDIHMKVHIDGDVECKICRIPFTKRSLRMHEKRRHPELETKSIKSIERNITKQRGEINEKKSAYRYQCSVCKLFFINTKTMDTHMKVHIYGDVECKICRIRFTKRSLHIHERRRHPELQTKPNITKPEVNVTRKHNKHEESQHSKDLVEPKDVARQLEYRCDLCQLYCHTEKRLEKHKIIHSVGDLKCEVCQVMFTQMSLAKHQIRAHPRWKKRSILKAVKNTAVPELDNTPEASQQSQELLEPIDNTLQRKYRHLCDICNLMCQTAERLEKHKRIHSDGNVKCEVCQIMFTQMSLTKHQMRVHPRWKKRSILKAVKNTAVPELDNTPEASQQSQELLEPIDNTLQRKYRHLCDICNLMCQTAERLEKHKRIHSDGNVKCEVCQIMFTQMSLTKHQMRVHPRWKKRSILKAVKNTAVPELDNTPETSQQSQELLEPIDNTLKRKYRHLCDICNLMCQTAERLQKHKRIHSNGNVNCELCQVAFTQRSIVHHKNRVHPGWETQSILKAVENTTVPEMIGKKQTSMKDFYSAINKRRHTVHISNAVKREPPMFVKRRLSEYREFKCGICDKVLSTQKHLSDHTKSHFQCYICKKYFETMSHLSPHLKSHILYQQWVDPLNVHLSNWSFNQSREILQNQPLVLVENLEINNINLKSLSQYDERQNVFNDQDSSKGNCSKESERKSMVKNEVSQCIVGEDSCKREDNGVCENYDEQRSANYLPMNNNQLTMSQELSNIICVNTLDDDSLLVENSAVDDSVVDDSAVDNSVMDCAVDSTVIDISSGDESDVEAIDDLSDRFFCYFCERLFHSCDALGVHMDRCTMK